MGGWQLICLLVSNLLTDSLLGASIHVGPGSWPWQEGWLQQAVKESQVAPPDQAGQEGLAQEATTPPVVSSTTPAPMPFPHHYRPLWPGMPMTFLGSADSPPRRLDCCHAGCCRSHSSSQSRRRRPPPSCRPRHPRRRRSPRVPPPPLPTR